MPTYDYLCPDGHRFEVIHGVTADGPDSCVVCGASPVRKAFTAPSIHFKGSGWAKKDRSSAKSSSTRAAAADGSASGTGASDSSSSSSSSADTGADVAKTKDAGATASASADSTRKASDASSPSTGGTTAAD